MVDILMLTMQGFGALSSATVCRLGLWEQQIFSLAFYGITYCTLTYDNSMCGVHSVY